MEKRKNDHDLQLTTKFIETLVFGLKGLPSILPTWKGENKAFPPLSPQCNVVLQRLEKEKIKLSLP